MVSFGRGGGEMEGLEYMFFVPIQREALGGIYAREGLSRARREGGK